MVEAAVQLTQAVAKMHSRPPILCFVTTAAQRNCEALAMNPASVGVWGLGRSCRAECNLRVQCADADGSGGLDLNELRVALHGRAEAVSEAILHAIFSFCDHSEDGQISLAELLGKYGMGSV